VRPDHLSSTECPLCGARFIDIRLFTLDEAALKVNVKKQTIQRWIKAGELDARVWVRGKVGPVRYMIDSYDLEDFMLRHFPKRSTLAPDAENELARRAYRILKFRKPPKLRNP